MVMAVTAAIIAGALVADSLRPPRWPSVCLPPATPGAEGLALSVSGDALSAAVADVLAALKGPFKFGLWGIAIYGVLPSEIAKDDPKMMSKIVTSLPADTVTETPVSSLPLDRCDGQRH